MIALGLVCVLMFAVFFALLHFGERFFQKSQGLSQCQDDNCASGPASVSSSFHSSTDTSGKVRNHV